MIPAAPNTSATAPSRTGVRGRRPAFRGRRHDGPSNKQGLEFGMNLCSRSSSVSSDWLYSGPIFEAQVVPDGPVHPSQQGNQSSRNHQPTADGVAENGQEPGSSCIPSSILAEINVKNRNLACTAKVQGWGSFSSALLPAKISCTRTRFHEKASWQHDNDYCGGERDKRLDIFARLGEQTPGLSPRAREQVKRLLTATQGVLCDVRSSSRPARKKLAKAVVVDGTEVLHQTSGARMGLEVISALEDIVSDESEVRVVCKMENILAHLVKRLKVYKSCFRTLVQKESSACRERGELLEVMRRHYSTLLEEVVERLSQLKASLESTIDEEERLKRQAHSVQRLTKLLAESAKVDEDHRQQIASMPQTELEKFVASRHPQEIATGEIAQEETSATLPATMHAGGEGEQNKRGAGKPSLAVKSILGVVEEREEAARKGENTEATRHLMASMKMDMLYEMIEERAAARREQQRRLKWRQYNAATTIKNWWRKLNPPEWEESDRQYAAILIQARARGRITRVLRKRALEEFKVSRGMVAMAKLCRMYLAVRERKRRARVVQLALRAGLRVLDKAIADLEIKASSLQAETQARLSQIQQSNRPSLSAITGASRPDTKAVAGTDIPSSSPAAPEKGGGPSIMVDGVASDRAKEHTVSTLVERLTALGQVLDKCKGCQASFVLADVGVDDGRGQTSFAGIASCSPNGRGGLKGTAKRRHN